jgi:hypothetical protein
MYCHIDCQFDVGLYEMNDILKEYYCNIDIWDTFLILSPSEGMLILCHNFQISLTLDNQSDILRCAGVWNMTGG